jgi:hypothetical protein
MVSCNTAPKLKHMKQSHHVEKLGRENHKPETTKQRTKQKFILSFPIFHNNRHRHCRRRCTVRKKTYANFPQHRIISCVVEQQQLPKSSQNEKKVFSFPPDVYCSSL